MHPAHPAHPEPAPAEPPGAPAHTEPPGAPAPAVASAGEPAVRGPIDRRDFIRLAGMTGALGVAAAGLPALLSRGAVAHAATSAPGLQRAALASTFSPLRPPAVPLAVRSMYLSTWMPSSSLPGTWPTFWNGRITAITGLVLVDGTTYTWCGAPSENFTLATQTALTVTATQSQYTLTAGPVTLTATFFSPVDPASLPRQSVPMSYISVTAAANDGGSHSVSVYLDISAEWAHGDDTQEVSWGQQAVGGLNVLTVTPSSPTVLAEFNDQASWGTVVWATDNVTGLTWQTGQDVVVRGNAAAGTLPDTSDTAQPRAINDDWPVFGFLRSLGTVTATPSAPMVVCLGHVREPAVSYLGTDLNPYWTTFWSSWQSMLTWFRADLPAAQLVCAATDAAVDAWAGQQLGAGSAQAQQYAAITSLALRQAFGGTELVVAPGGAPWAFLKEISSDGNVSTLDVMFPAFSAYLQLSPRYLELLLAPIFDYVENHAYPNTWAPHDLGSSYPNAAGHLSGTGEENMPIEESGNILMMACAVAARMAPADATAYATVHYPILRQWAEYLLSVEPNYPGTQNQTDDFTGVIAASVNLNLKGIVGLAVFSQLAGFAGNAADRASFASTARSFIGQWASLGQDSGAAHLDLAYGDTGTYSLKYNAFPDRLLNTNLVSPAIQASEAAWYVARANAYGVPLDSRHTYTKGDWEMLTAAFLYAQPAARNLLVTDLYDFLNTSSSRVPFTDWYDTVADTQNGFQDRPVVGGTFALDTLRYTPGGLTGYWPFDASGALDASGNGGDLTLAGGAGFTTGHQAGALAVSGSGQSAGSARPVVRTDGSFTVTAWVNMTSASGFHTAVSQDGASVSGFYLQYSAADGRWAFAMTSADSTGAATTRALSAAAPALSAWTHLAGVHDAVAGQLLLYVNGSLADTVSYTGGWSANGGLQVGRGRWGTPTDYFPGAIDEVRTFSRVLTAAQIASSAGLTSGLVASYALDEGSGASAADQVGGHTLALGGAGWGAGYSGSALTLNGSSAAATTAGFVATSGSFSVSAWVRLADIGGWHTAVSQDGANASAFFLQYSAADDAWAFSMLASDATSAATTRALAPLPPRAGDWQHLVGVYDSAAGQLRLYVDGIRAGAAAFSSGWASSGSFAVGRGLFGGPTDWFSGSIDQVRVWSRALSDADVAALV
jgi:Domain of unknown function (DUF5127)/Domain of unknown function (DUF4965)/Domain of unknown function (DUF1793)/Concanavalin A-like lectin/glucanases superfamily/Domain of unknown function (DUF4964)